MRGDKWPWVLKDEDDLGDVTDGLSALSLDELMGADFHSQLGEKNIVQPGFRAPDATYRFEKF